MYFHLDNLRRTELYSGVRALRRRLGIRVVPRYIDSVISFPSQNGTPSKMSVSSTSTINASKGSVSWPYGKVKWTSPRTGTGILSSWVAPWVGRLIFIPSRWTNICEIRDHQRSLTSKFMANLSILDKCQHEAAPPFLFVNTSNCGSTEGVWV